MKKILTSVIIVALSIASTGSIAEQTAAGFYFGGAVGTSKMNVDRTTIDPKNKGYSALEGSSISAKDHAFTIMAGYQFNRIIAIEGAYSNIGDFEWIEDKDKIKDKIRIKSLSVNLGYSFPHGIRPFVLIGLASVQLKQNIGEQEAQNKSTGIHYGAGLEFTPANSKGVAFRLSYEVDSVSFTNAETQQVPGSKEAGEIIRLNNADADFSTITFGATYKF